MAKQPVPLIYIDEIHFGNSILHLEGWRPCLLGQMATEAENRAQEIFE